VKRGNWTTTIFLEFDRKETLIGYAWLFTFHVATRKRRWVNLKATLWPRPLRLLLGNQWVIGEPSRAL
jgi:hypothetical protein